MCAIFRSSHPDVFCQKGVLENFSKFTGKHLHQSLFFNKVAGPRPATLLKKRLWHKCFPASLTKVFKNVFSYRTPPVAASEFQWTSDTRGLNLNKSLNLMMSNQCIQFKQLNTLMVADLFSGFCCCSSSMILHIQFSLNALRFEMHSGNTKNVHSFAQNLVQNGMNLFLASSKKKQWPKNYTNQYSKTQKHVFRGLRVKIVKTTSNKCNFRKKGPK